MWCNRFRPYIRQGSKSLWMLANSCIQPRYAQVVELSLQAPRGRTLKSALWALSMSSGRCADIMTFKKKKKRAYSLAPITRALAWLRYCSNQANSWLCVCVRKGEISTRAGLLHSAAFAEINPASPVVPDSRRRLCQLSAMPLCSILLAVRCCDCCPTLSTQPLVFITIPARTAGTAVLWVPTAF